MQLSAIKKVTGRAVPLLGDDIDTDRIIPARFMKCVTFDGLGQYAFYDERKDADGRDREHPLNDPRHRGASILISGANFGCGSSREHAPQSLRRFGFEAVLAETFAEIFFGNATTLGMPCVSLDRPSLEALAQTCRAQPDLELTIDLEALQVQAGDQTYACRIVESARSSLIAAEWDPIGELMEGRRLAADRLAELHYGRASG